MQYPEPCVTDILAMSVILCRFCNNLILDQKMENVPILEWINGITKSSCQYCCILVQAIKKLEPDLLRGKICCDKDADIFVNLGEVSDGWKFITINEVKDGWHRSLLSINFYTENGMLRPCSILLESRLPLLLIIATDS